MVVSGRLVTIDSETNLPVFTDRCHILFLLTITPATRPHTGWLADTPLCPKRRIGFPRAKRRGEKRLVSAESC